MRQAFFHNRLAGQAQRGQSSVRRVPPLVLITSPADTDGQALVRCLVPQRLMDALGFAVC